MGKEKETEAISGMNATLKRMHKMRPRPHKDEPKRGPAVKSEKSPATPPGSKR
jgi:hypothetical protein